MVKPALPANILSEKFCRFAKKIICWLSTTATVCDTVDLPKYANAACVFPYCGYKYKRARAEMQSVVTVEHGLAMLVTSTQDAEMAKTIEKIHNSTFRQTANGLAEKTITVRETDSLDTVDHSNQIYWVSVCRVSRQAPARSASREGRIRKLTKISCFAVVSLPNVVCICIPVHLLAPTSRQLVCAHQARAISLAGTHWKNALQLLVCVTRPKEKLVKKLERRSCFVQRDWKRSTENRPGRDPDLAPFAWKCSRGVSL